MSQFVNFGEVRSTCARADNRNLANDTLAMSDIENKELTLNTYHYVQTSSGTLIVCQQSL